MSRLITRFVLAVLATVLAAPAAAQDAGGARPGRPYRGLFGGGVGEMEQSLNATASIGAGYDDQALADLGVIGIEAPGARQNDPAHGQVSGGLSYSLNRTRIGFSASANMSGRYFPGAATQYVGTRSGAVGLSLALSRQAGLSLNHAVSYRPYNVLPLAPVFMDPGLGQVVVPDHSLGVRRDAFVNRSSDVAFNRRFGRRGSVDLSYGHTQGTSSSNQGDLTTTSGAGRVSFGLTKGLGLRLGYGYTEGELARNADDRKVAYHNIDAGIDFSRDLSISRRTKLAMTTGSAIVTERGTRSYRLTGNARLNREIGQTWNAALAYSRGLGFVEYFAEPFFSDSISVGIEGLVSRRVRFTSRASGALGEVGMSGATPYRSYQGNAGVTTALSRAVAITVDYTYYHYAFNGAVPALTAFPGDMDRQSVRAVLTIAAPLVQRARRSDASR